jgi:uncharacterized protein
MKCPWPVYYIKKTLLTTEPMPYRLRSFLLFILLLSTGLVHVHAQRALSNPLIDSKAVIEKGVKLHEDGKYKEAISEYLKVPASDTGYSTVLHELILSYYTDSNFVQAEKYGKLALELYPEKKAQWYTLLANVYDDTKRADMALKAYDTILAENRYNYLTYFNKGITLYRQSRHDEATANFQRCIMVNPYYSSAHYFLGQLSLLRGNMVQAMMSFSTNLMISPGNRYKNNSIQFLNTIAEMNTTATGYLEKYKPGKEDNFEEIQDILVSKAALDKNYKLKAELNDKIVRQLQVVLEKLEYNANDKGFWMQYYTPLFKKLWDNRHFEPLVFNMFSDLDIKQIKDYTRKEKKAIEAFSESASDYLNEIRESQELLFNKRENARPRYYVRNYVVSGKGDYGKNAKSEKTLIGPWEFYYSTGRIQSKGSFNSEGLRNGEWLAYYENGLLKSSTNYSGNKANGKAQVWNDNAVLYTSSTYADDETHGEELTYYYNGKLSSAIHYKAGKKDGIAKYYNVDGNLTVVANYINDQQEGEQTYYHPNGKIESVAKYVKNLPVGEYKEYFDNGKMKTTGNFTEGKKSGEWKGYHKDGSVASRENYNKGELEGESISYYENGKVESKSFYKKGEVDGKKEDFDDDGLVFCESIFESGRLRDIKFFDKKGAVISNTTSRRGAADITFYSADGTKRSKGTYSKDGVAEGKFTEYFKSGRISSDGFYKNGLLEDKKTLFYADGKLSMEGTYKAGKAQGYFINYFNNEKLSNEGWYVEDERQGTFISYDLLGNLSSKVYYLNDKVHGITEYYTPTKKLDFKEYYDNGWFNKIEQFDTTGKIMLTSELKKGEGKVRFNHFNGKPYFESNYKYYKLNGVYTVTNGDGSKNMLCYYKNGNLDSNYVAWYPNGKIRVEGKYIDGDKTGTWKYYYYHGGLSETEQYVEGRLDGPDVRYNEDGTKSKESVYTKGDVTGEYKYYGENGQLMVVFYYKDDNIQAYSYEDKTGKLVPRIPLLNGGGTVESYYKNGSKSAHMVFQDGVTVGERILYSTNGNQREVSNYINGLKNGTVKTYYPSGKIMREENFYYGEPHGSSKYYNENGTLISEVNLYLGKLHGECKYYTSGKVTQTYNYYYGVLESKN